MQDIQGAIVLVTGGAGGIGSALCAALANAGATVLIGVRSDSAASTLLLESLHGSGHRTLFCPVDSSPDLRKAADRIRREFGRLDVLVNNAGITRFVPHDDLNALDDELFDAIMRTNARGTFATIRTFRSLLERASHPLIVNISSVAAQTGVGSNVAYCASKAAVDSITRSLGRALAPKIRIVSVAPGVVDTDFIRGLDPEWREHQIRATPLRRFAHPQEIADAVLAAIQQLTFTTGSVIPVDGGRPLG